MQAASSVSKVQEKDPKEYFVVWKACMKVIQSQSEPVFIKKKKAG